MEKSKTGNNTATVSVGRIVMNIVRKYQDSKGISLPQLKKILRETKKLDILLHDSGIKLALKNAMDRGVLSREGGFYKVVEVKSSQKALIRKRKGKEETSTNSGKIPKAISPQSKRPRKGNDKEATRVNLPDKTTEAKPRQKGLTRQIKVKEETSTNLGKIPKTITRQSKRSRKEDNKESSSVNPPDKTAEAKPRHNRRARKIDDKGLTSANSERPIKISDAKHNEKDSTTEDVMEPNASNPMIPVKIPNPKALVEISQEKASDQQ